MKRYLRLFLFLVRQNIQSAAAEPLDFWTYLFGKLIRMGFFFMFIFSIFTITPRLAGYTLPAAVLIFATYNFVDIITQIFFFRSLYQLQTLVRTGRFDAMLTYPVSSLFYVTFRMFDVIDLTTLVPVLGIFVWSVLHLDVTHIVLPGLLYLLLLLNGILATFSISVLFASLTFWTDELSHVWFLYRTILRSGRYPIEIFRQPIRFLFTWIIPLGLMVTFPVQAFLGILSWQFMILAFVVSLSLFCIALSVWNFALRHYSSASS